MLVFAAAVYTNEMGVSWEQVSSHLSTLFDDVEADGARVAGRLSGQPIVVELASAWDEPWLLIISPVASEHQLSRPIDALRWSAQMSVGGIVVIDDMLAVRAALCLADMEWIRLERYICFVAREAHRLASLHNVWGPPERAVDFLAD